jgi:hypothetical protein
MSAALLERLDAIDDRLAALERALSARAAPAGPRDDADVALLAAVGASVGTAAFSSRELIRHGGVDPLLGDALRHADCVTAGDIGYLLRRCDGEIVAGRRLVRVGRDADGVIWQFVSL